jgi:hypothetical protein
MNKFEIFERLIEQTDQKLKLLRDLGMDRDETLRHKWVQMEKTMKVVEHKVAALKDHAAQARTGTVLRLDRPLIDRGLDRAIQAAELLNSQLDDLLENAKTEND